MRAKDTTRCPNCRRLQALEEEKEAVPIALLSRLDDLAEIEALVLLRIDLDDRKPSRMVLSRFRGRSSQDLRPRGDEMHDLHPEVLVLRRGDIYSTRPIMGHLQT